MSNKIRRWDFDLEGIVCPTCKGKSQILQTRDLHRSEGLIPCPRKYFEGHGYPFCGDDGTLHFSEYDLNNKDYLMKKYPQN